MPKSDYLIAQTLAYLDASYVALYKGDPTTTSELSAAGYSRQATGWNATPGNPAKLPQDVTFGPAGEDWGAISHVAIFDAATGGNMLYYGEFDSPKTIEDGDEATIRENSLTVEEE